MNIRSIHVRLIAWYSALVIAVLLVFGIYTYHSLESVLYSEMEETLTRRAKQIADNILPQTLPSGVEAISSHIEAMYSPEASNRFIRILADKNIPIYVSGTPQDGRFDPASVPLPRSALTETATRIESLPSGQRLLIVAMPATLLEKPITIEMGFPTDSIDRALHRLIITLLIGLPVVLLIVATGGYGLVQRSLKPVEDIRETAEQITFGNLSNRLPVATSGDVLEHLSVTLNQMLDRLENAYDQASRFSADASHELRTPLTIIRTELESIVREPSLSSGIRERAGTVLEEAERLSSITESLFAISRLDAGDADMVKEPVKLGELVRTTAEQMSLLAEEKRIAVEVDINPDTRVLGDSARLKQVIVNLLDNAVKYTLAGGKIYLSVHPAGNKVLLEVHDNGIGISAHALPHIFERFYRADKTRSRELGGAGLGLSIVRAVCQAHGGSVEAESVEGKGSRFIVKLPLLRQTEAV